MRVSHFLALAAVTVACVTGSARAQGPLYDKVVVDLPYSVSVNNMVLQPGHYVIRQFESQAGGSRVLQIFDDRGMRLETTVMTIAALDLNTPQKTSVILHHYGPDYYFDKIWVQGKNYGYEFPLPPSVKSREHERMAPYTVAAEYVPAPQPEVAQNTPAAAPEPEAQPEPAPAPAPAPVEATPAPAPVPVPAPETNTMPTTASNWG